MKNQPRVRVGQTLQYEEYPRCLQCGGEIPYEKRHLKPLFCSRECWREYRCGPPIQCANPSCQNLLPKVPVSNIYCSAKCRMEVQKAPVFCDNPSCSSLIPERRRTPHYQSRYEHRYCSRSCWSQHAQQRGLLHDASRKGNEAQRIFKEEHGHVPGIEQRRETALKNLEKARRST